MFRQLHEYWRTVRLGIDNVRVNKLRSVLTVLGIVFGVCSVISLLSIGEGASAEVQEQIRRLGSDNIILQSIKPPQNSNQESQGGSFLLEYGLTYADADRMNATLPGIASIVPMKSQPSDLWVGANKVSVQLGATVPWLINNGGIQLIRGRFLSAEDIQNKANVIVIGQDAATALFQYHDPIDAPLKVDSDVYKVIGIVGSTGPAPGAAAGGVSLASQNTDAYVPITTWRSRQGDSVIRRTQGGQSAEKVELTEMIIKVKSPEAVLPTASLIERMLTVSHPTGDFKLTVPLRLLEEAERTKRIFSMVLSSIAAISLLVGGIGIMNIMLASVSERTREIGVRRALGARQRDIMSQFLVETLILSVGGGIIGMALGAAVPSIVTYYSQIRTILTPFAFILSFAVSAVVGLVFGLYPARRAAMMDPIEALRHE